MAVPRRDGLDEPAVFAEPSGVGRELRAAWRDTVRHVDTLWEKARQQHGYLGCRSGCARCCQSTVYITAIDAAEVSVAFFELSVDAQEAAVVRAQAQMTARDHALDPAFGTPCPLLLDNKCSIYSRRPAICRLHGFTKLESNGGLNMCPENAHEVARRGTASMLPNAEQPLAALSLAQASRKICTYLTIAEAVLLAHRHGPMDPVQVDAYYQESRRPVLAPL